MNFFLNGVDAYSGPKNKRMGVFSMFIFRSSFSFIDLEIGMLS